jgi:hypothetical protein
MWRAKRFGDIIVDTKSAIQKPLLPRGVHISTHAQTGERFLRQDEAGTRQSRQGPSPKRQHIAPGAPTQHLRIYLECRERPLSEEADSLISH